MSGLTVPKRGNAATRLAELNAEHAAQNSVTEPSEEPVETNPETRENAEKHELLEDESDTVNRQHNDVPPLASQNSRQASASPQVRKSASPHLRAEGRADGSEAVRTGVSTGGRTDGRTAVREQGRAAGRKGGRAPASEEVEMPPLLEDEVLERLAARPRYQNGVKTSVEMSADDSLRIKRFLLDHGPATTRDLMLTLTLAFLERKGY